MDRPTLFCFLEPHCYFKKGKCSSREICTHIYTHTSIHIQNKKQSEARTRTQSRARERKLQLPFSQYILKQEKQPYPCLQAADCRPSGKQKALLLLCIQQTFKSQELWALLIKQISVGCLWLPSGLEPSPSGEHKTFGGEGRAFLHIDIHLFIGEIKDLNLSNKHSTLRQESTFNKGGYSWRGKTINSTSIKNYATQKAIQFPLL